MGRSTKFALLAGCVLLASTAGQLSASVRLHMVDGKTLDARSYRLEADTIFAEVDGGDSLGFPSSRIARIESIFDPDSESVKPSSPSTDTRLGLPRNVPVAVTVPEPVPGQATTRGVPPGVPPGVPTTRSIDELIQSAAARHRLDPDLLAAVIAVESGYKPGAVSHKGAQGLMQLMPATARELSVTNPLDAAQNIEGGARYLRQLLDQHGDSFVSALAAYNAGMGRVARYKGVPPYRETIRYIERVLTRYASAARNAADKTPSSGF